MSIRNRHESRSITLRARYIFPVIGRPIRDGWVTVVGDRIVACGAGVPPAPTKVGETPAPQEFCDLGNVAILPGLINAHVHLDFSDLTNPIGEPGLGFADWIRRVMLFRRETTAAAKNPVSLGLQESLRCGVTTLGDIAQPGWLADEMAASPLSVTVFQELIAPTAARVAGALTLAKSHVQSGTTGLGSVRPGLSPHSPFTVHPELLSAIVSLSAAEQIPVAMHLAESQEEMELLRHGTGPLRVLLEELGAWDPTTIRPGSRPMDYLRLLASASRALVIHGNYLDDDEIAFVGANRERMSVVYCPRTHDWFARGEYPLEKMHAAGVTVALGTDGRGSSPDLSLLGEMRFAARRHPTVGLDRILEMGTLLGAKALGLDQDIGSLEPGKQADLTIVALPDRDAADPHELLFASDEPVTACYCRGELQ